LGFRPLRDDVGAWGFGGGSAVVPVVIFVREGFHVVGVWRNRAFFVLVSEVDVFLIDGCWLEFLLHYKGRKVEPEKSRKEEYTQGEHDNW
jgi:hypothetical protein